MEHERARFTRGIGAYPAPGNPEAPDPNAKAYPTAVWAGIAVIGLLFACALLGFFILLGIGLAS